MKIRGKSDLMAKSRKDKNVETLTHDKARRINVPTAELQSLADQQEELAPRPPEHYARARPLPRARRASAIRTSIRRSSGTG